MELHPSENSGFPLWGHIRELTRHGPKATGPAGVNPRGGLQSVEHDHRSSSFHRASLLRQIFELSGEPHAVVPGFRGAHLLTSISDPPTSSVLPAGLF